MKLTEKQIIAARHKNGPCLVLAVPGSGKTTMLLERISIMEKDIDPRKILSLTFSKAQAVDMRKRYPDSKSNFMTIHAFCYLIIRNYLKKSNKQFRLLESDRTYNKYSLVRDLYFQVNNKSISKEDLNLFFQKISFMKNNLENISYLDDIEIKNAKKIYNLYEDFKREHFYIDFDDMQIFALSYLEDQRLLRSIKNKYKYFQLDEGQDTSLLQFKILEKIVFPENNLLIVADDDQSIYSFRAAHPKYLLDFKKHYPDAKILSLDQNHRSQKNIVDVSNKFIQLNKYRYKKDLFTLNEEKSSVKIVSLKDSQKEYEFIKKNIDKNVKTAILYRNNISSINLINNLIEDEIDFSINVNNLDFLKTNIFDDLVDIINFSEDFYRTDLFENIYYKIKTYISKDQLRRLRLKDEKKDVFQFFNQENLSSYQYQALFRKKREFKHLRKLSLDKKISYIYKDMGYEKYAKINSSKHNLDSYNKEVYIESLINFSKNLNTIEELKEKIDKTEKLIKSKKDSNLILSTIHGSKGLEYDDVFVVDLVKNEFPVISFENYYENIEEERRIFYVAMTRAKNKLYLMTIRNRNGKKVQPSEFYEEIKNIRI